MKRTPKSHAGFLLLSMDNLPPPSQEIFIRPRRPGVHVTGDPAIAVGYHFIDIPINLGIGKGRRIFDDKAPPVGRTAGLPMALPVGHEIVAIRKGMTNPVPCMIARHLAAIIRKADEVPHNPDRNA